MHFVPGRLTPGRSAGVIAIEPTFATVPREDIVLVLTHLQNDFWHPDGRGYAFTRDTLPFPDTKERIGRVLEACRAARPLRDHRQKPVARSASSPRAP